MTVNIKVGAQLDTGDITRQLAELTRKINAAGQAIARQGGQKFEPINQATVDQLQRVETTMRNIQRLAPQVAQRLKGSGQANTSLFDVDWRKAYTDPRAAHRAASGVFTMATGLGFQATPAPPPPPLPPAGGGAAPPGGRPPGGRSPAFSPPPPRPPNPVGQMAVNTFTRGLQAAGPVGAAGASGLRAGMSGGFGAGAMGFAGALAGFGVSALIGGVRQYVGAAQQESIGYHDLRNQMGGTGGGVGFNDLRSRIRGASDQAGVTYEEAQGFGRLYTRRANITSAEGLAGDVAHGAGFGRSFGFDPAGGVQAFAGMRGVGVTRSTDDSRRLGAMIAEGIARAGVFGRAEEFLQEIAGYAEQQTRSSLSRANVEGYTGALTGLLALRQPGLDVAGSANLLNRANAAIERGGAAGEASQAFLYQTVGRRLGLGPLETQIMQEGGMFATGRQTFGDGTAIGDDLRRQGRGGSIARAAGSDATNFQMVQEGLRSRYTDPLLRMNATSNMFGINMRQASALDRLRPEELGGISRLLSEEQIRGLSATGIQTTARIATGNRGELDRIADEFGSRSGRGALTPAERRQLSDARTRADAGDPGAEEAYRRLLAEISAGRQQEETEGGRTRRTLQDIDKTLQDMATALIDPLNTARDALLSIAGRNGQSMTVSEARRRRLASEISEVNESEQRALAGTNAERSALQDAAARARGLANNNRGDPALARAAEEAEARAADLEARRQGIIEEHRRRRERVTQSGRMEERAAAAAAEGRTRLEALREGAEGGIQAERRERTNAEFAREFGPAAERVAERLGVPASTILGHWASESHRGRSFAGQNNPGNMTAMPSQSATEGGDRDASGNPIRQRFRNFANMNEFADAYASWVERRAPGARGAASPEAYFRELQRGGYATAPNFVPGTSNVARGYQGLPLPPPTPGNTPMPPGAPPNAVQTAPGQTTGPQRISGLMEGVFRLEDQRGQPLAQPILVVTGWRAARPFGATGSTPA